MSKIVSYDLGYADVYVFQNYLINQIKENITVDLEHVDVLRNMIKQNHGDRRLVYISNRSDDYHVDPLVYPEVARIRNLLGMATVTSQKQYADNSKFEKLFYNKPFAIFQTLEESIVWAAGIISNSDLRALVSESK